MALERQGPITGKGRVEADPTLKGKTDEPAPEKLETTGETPQTQVEGRAEPDKGTSKEKQAPKKSAAEESFLEEFDISSLSEEGRAAYESLNKQFKSAYTKKLEGLKKEREKVAAYDNFMTNPEQSLREAARQYGYQMVPVNQANQRGPAQGSNGDLEAWEPKTWAEVRENFFQEFQNRMMNQFRPVFENIKSLTSTTIERQLTEIDPDWKMYEEEMMSNLQEHPTLAKNVSKLYKLSVPEDVLRNKYTQAALKKFEDKAKNAKVASKSSVSASQPSTNKKLTFNEAVEEAKRRIAS